MARLRSHTKNDAASLIKNAARRLFAERGVDGVTVREIAEAAGQKNHGSVSYYFGSKEDLVRALIIDGAKSINDRRNALLDELEASGGPRAVRDIVDILIAPIVEQRTDGDDPEHSFSRFMTMLRMTHTDLVLNTFDEDLYNSSYQRCLTHLRALLSDLPEATRTQRFVFMESYLSSVMVARDRKLSDVTRPHAMWNAPSTVDHFARTMTAMLTC